MNQEYRIGDEVMIYKVGTIIEARYDKVRDKVMYTIEFEDGQDGIIGNLGFASVTQDVLVQPSAQKMTREERDLYENSQN